MKLLYVCLFLASIILVQISLADFGIGRLFIIGSGLECLPSSITKTIAAGSSTTQNITVDHIGAYPGSYIATFNASDGIPGSWVNFSLSSVVIPTPPATNVTTLNISVPDNQSAGTFYGWINATSPNGNCNTSLAVTVTTVSPPPPSGGGGGGFVGVQTVLD